MTIRELIDILDVLLDDGIDPSTPIEIYGGEDSFTGESTYTRIDSCYSRVGRIILE